MRVLDPTKITILACMLVVLGVPFLFRPDTGPSGDADRRVIVITPHNEQIRTEFARGFAAWHERNFDETAEIVWVTPGGTSEIRRQLQSIYSKAIKDGQILPDGTLAPGVPPMPQDVIFGGGTYEHGEVKKGVTVVIDPGGADRGTLDQVLPILQEVHGIEDREFALQALAWLTSRPESRLVDDFAPNEVRAPLRAAIARTIEQLEALQELDENDGTERDGLIARLRSAGNELGEAEGIGVDIKDYLGSDPLRDAPELLDAVSGTLDWLERLEELEPVIRVIEAIAPVSYSTALEALDVEGRGSVAIAPNGIRAVHSMSVPVTVWTDSELEALFGPNYIGPRTNNLYDPEKHWVGTATSGFGIVYNRDVLRELGLGEPTKWEDFGDPRLTGWVALADPRQSGSVATLYDSILNNEGWDKGWRILREMCANARYFANSSTKVPLDVSQGQAGMGVSIDFYGRTQAQAVMRDDETPETSRVGYVDPPGAVYIDPDPISLLRAGPDPEMGNRFIAFVLSDEGQALWQFAAHDGEAPAYDAADPGTWGPERFELRRMPVRRDFIDDHMQRLTDKVDPFEIAAPTTTMGWRSSVGIMMAAFGIDTHGSLVEAWEALSAARADEGFPATTLAEMETLFYAMPAHVFPDGRAAEFSPESYTEIRNAWRDPGERRRAKIAYTRFFKTNYERVVELRENPGSVSTLAEQTSR